MIRKNNSEPKQEGGVELKKRFSFSNMGIIAWIIGVLGVIGPLMWIPAISLSITSSKGFVFIFAFLAMVLLYGIHILRRGEIIIPQHFIFKILGILVIFGFIGSLFAPSFGMSFWGYGFETTTWFFLLVFSGFIFFASQVIRSKNNINKLFLGMLITTILLIVLHTLRFFLGADFAHMYILGGVTDSLTGAWSDFLILLGVAIFGATITIELGTVNKKIKTLLGIFAIIATSILFAANAQMIFLIVGFVALLGSLYLFSFAFWDKKEKIYQKKQRAPWGMLVLLIIMIGGVFLAPRISSLISSYQNITLRDARPSLQGTIEVAKNSIIRNPVTGYGMNTFAGVWNKTKPAVLSGTVMGSNNFNIGFGYIPTHMATGGASAIILWILFLGSLLVLIIKTITRGFETDADRYVLSMLGLIIITGLVFMFVYIPGNSVLILFAILIGSLLGVLAQAGSVSEKKLSFIKDPRVSFFGILGITALIGLSVVGAFFMIRKMSSLIHYSQGIVLLNQGKQEEGAQRITQAAALFGHDIYYQKISENALQQARTLAGTLNQINKDQVSKQIEQVLGTALGAAQQAVAKNSLDYKNYLLLGTVYQTMVSLGVSDAYRNAENAFHEAVSRNKEDSTMLLLFANLALTQKNNETALDFIKQSINKYPTRDAYLLRGQIEISQQKWASAIVSFNQVLRYSPSDVITYIKLAIAYEKSGDIVNAQKIYDAVKKAFSDGDQTIQKIKTNLGITAIPVTGSIDPKGTTVAPNQKKK